MKKIALVDKYDRGINYNNIFPDMDIDKYHLSSVSKKKLLKADKDIQIETDDYDYVILVGAEATKHFTTAAVSSHQGYLVDEKFLPLIEPAMLIFKPSMKDSFEKAISNIIQYIEGTKKEQIHRDSVGIEDTDQAMKVLSEMLELSPRPVAIDTETSALYPRDGIVLGVSIAIRIDQGFYISADILDDDCLYILQQIINKHTVVFQNAKFDISFMQYHLGLDFGVKDVTNSNSFEDTMLMHYILDETTGTHGLKDNCIKYTDLGDYDRDLELFKRSYCRTHKIKISDFTYDLIPFDIMYPYAAIDAMGTLELYGIFKPLIEGTRLGNAYRMILCGAKLLIQIENNGVPFAKDRLEKAQILLAKEIYELEQDIYKVPEVSRLEKELNVKFNPNSTMHLGHLFFNILGLPSIKKTPTGAHSTDAEVLAELTKLHPIVAKVSAIKKAKKIKSTYIDKILVGINRDNRLRTYFNIHTTTSGRLSSSGKLNMQQLPRDNKIVKACIMAPEGYVIVSQDLATAEMYVAAVLSKDKALMKVFEDKQAGTGADFHSTIAHMVFRLPCRPDEVKELYPHLRQAAKAISFGILYGSGPQKVADTVNEEGKGTFTLQDAKEAITKYFGTFPKLKKWLTDNQNFIKANGFVYSIFDRKRRLGDVFSRDRTASGHAIRSGINFLVQSVASDINLKACVEIQDYINKSGIDVELFGLVHDSILAVVKEENLDEYLEIAAKLTQKDHGVMIPGCPIGIDQEVGNDYSFKEGIFDEAA